MWHGENYLTKAIELLDDENRDDFSHFVKTQCSFNPENMFICKSKSILKDYYQTIFPWLERCEAAQRNSSHKISQSPNLR